MRASAAGIRAQGCLAESLALNILDEAAVGAAVKIAATNATGFAAKDRESLIQAFLPRANCCRCDFGVRGPAAAQNPETRRSF